MRFEEYIRRTAPLSYRDYMRYWERYRDTIESLGFERLPCNKWVLKLASKWLSWAANEGSASGRRPKHGAYSHSSTSSATGRP